MFTGKTPFKGASPNETFEKILTGTYTIPPNVPFEVKDLISKLLVQDPELRLGAHS